MTRTELEAGQSNWPGIPTLALTSTLCKQASMGKNSLGIEEKAVVTIPTATTGAVGSTRGWGGGDTLQILAGLEAVPPTSSASSNHAPTEQMPLSSGRQTCS